MVGSRVFQGSTQSTKQTVPTQQGIKKNIDTQEKGRGREEGKSRRGTRTKMRRVLKSHNLSRGRMKTERGNPPDLDGIQWWTDRTIPRDQKGSYIMDGDLVRILRGHEQGKLARVLWLGNRHIYARTNEKYYISRWFKDDIVRKIKKNRGRRTITTTIEGSSTGEPPRGVKLEPTRANSRSRRGRPSGPPSPTGDV